MIANYFFYISIYFAVGALLNLGFCYWTGHNLNIKKPSQIYTSLNSASGMPILLVMMVVMFCFRPKAILEVFKSARGVNKGLVDVAVMIDPKNEMYRVQN